MKSALTRTLKNLEKDCGGILIRVSSKIEYNMVESIAQDYSLTMSDVTQIIDLDHELLTAETISFSRSHALIVYFFYGENILNKIGRMNSETFFECYPTILNLISDIEINGMKIYELSNNDRICEYSRMLAYQRIQEEFRNLLESGFDEILSVFSKRMIQKLESVRFKLKRREVLQDIRRFDKIFPSAKIKSIKEYREITEAIQKSREFYRSPKTISSDITFTERSIGLESFLDIDNDMMIQRLEARKMLQKYKYFV